MTRFAYLRKLFVWNVLFLLANLFQELHVVIEDKLEKISFIYLLQKEKKNLDLPNFKKALSIYFDDFLGSLT